MDEVFGSLFSIIWLIVIFTIIKKGIEKGKIKNDNIRSIEKHIENAVKKIENHEPPEIIEDYEPEQKAPVRKKLKPGEARPARAALRETSALSDTITEDRQHDWLARQIREERKHTVWNNFVDMGAAHDEVCAAELNRRAHAREHQSYVVDDGVSDM